MQPFSPRCPLLLAAIFLIPAAPAAFSVTPDPSTSSTGFIATSPFGVSRNPSSGNYNMTWFGSIAGAGTGAPKSIEFTYTETLASDTTTNYSDLNPSGLPKKEAINFGTSLMVSGIFTTFVATPISPLANLSAANPSTLLPATDSDPHPEITAVVVPEPGTNALLIASLAALTFRRTRR